MGGTNTKSFDRQHDKSLQACEHAKGLVGTLSPGDETLNMGEDEVADMCTQLKAARSDPAGRKVGPILAHSLYCRLCAQKGEHCKTLEMCAVGDMNIH